MKWIRIATLLAALSAYAGCGTSPDSYYPMQEGTEWAYRVSVVSTRLDGKSGKLVTEKKETALSSTFLPKRDLAGKTVVPRKDVLDETQTSWTFLSKETGGISCIAFQVPDSAKPETFPVSSFLIRFPIKLGEKWDLTGISRLAGGQFFPMKASVESLKDDIQVPEGKFKMCMRVRSEAVKMFTVPPYGRVSVRVVGVHWYAPKAGLVKAIVNEESDNFELGTVKYTLERVKPKQ